jgi:type VI secretion system protein ImpA
MPFLDANKILAPISESEPCGRSKESEDNVDLLNLFAQMQVDGETARKIEQKRNEIEVLDSVSRSSIMGDLAGRSNDPNRDPGWSSLVDQAVELLEGHTKDTRAVCWLMESMLRAHGYEGFSEALDVTTELIERYGSQLFPRDAGSSTYAFEFIHRLTKSEMFLDGLRRVPVSREKPISYVAKVLASHLESVPAELRDDLLQSGLLLISDVEKQLASLDYANVEAFMRGLDSAEKSAEKLDALLQNQSDKVPYGFAPVRNELKSIREWFKSVLPPPPVVEATESNEASSGESGDSRKMGSTLPQGALQTRGEALSSLLKVAAFFRKTEPHSPLSYALEQAVRWGKMPLPSLLEDLISDRSVLSDVYRRMGIQEKNQEDS